MGSVVRGVLWPGFVLDDLRVGCYSGFGFVDVWRVGCCGVGNVVDGLPKTVTPSLPIPSPALTSLVSE